MSVSPGARRARCAGERAIDADAFAVTLQKYSAKVGFSIPAPAGSSRRHSGPSKWRFTLYGFPIDRPIGRQGPLQQGMVWRGAHGDAVNVGLANGVANTDDTVV